jgi:virginiamycin A acetyltransferase
MKLTIKAFFYLYLRIIRSCKYYLFQVSWRNLNKHNHTTAGRIFPSQTVEVGPGTYGALNVFTYANGNNERLVIGAYVAIANNVSFILGGNHNLDTITSYPMKTYFAGEYYQDSFSRGPIIIEDEAWFGFGCTVLSGVTIGKGAVIAAGSVVTKSVPPYAIVGGNPAKIIRFRFDLAVREVLINFKMSSLDRDSIIKNIDKFYTKVRTKDDVECILNALRSEE